MSESKKLELLHDQLEAIEAHDGDRLRMLVTMFESHFQQEATGAADGMAYEAECAMWAVGVCLDEVLETVSEQVKLTRQLLDQ